QVEQTRIALSSAKTNLGYTIIVAPFDGTIVSVPVKEGQTLNASQEVPTIVQMADLRQMAILIQISEGDVTKIKPGMDVSY
ncbi:HlyD family efflux transporter periplasmic adaptor subunit, partial [Staphylococcus aureus]|nr:HlyD family efflux transporter periplasmic adaptor subunit [Staphylococcus aureus]